MVEYRLIKCYPNSPKLGTVVNYSEIYKIYNYNGGNFYTELPKHQVESLPEFWEKITDKDELLKEAESRYPKGTKYYAINRNSGVDLNWNVGTSTGKFNYVDNGKIHITSEDNKSVYFDGKWAEVKEKPKEYEILSFRTPQNKKLYVGRNTLGKWYIYSEVAQRNFDRDDDWMIKNEYIIHSVKRLSDGEIFTIGDVVYETITDDKDARWTIKVFSLKDTRCFISGINIMYIEKYIDIFKPKYSEDDMKAFALEAILDGVSLNEWKGRHGKA